MIEVEHLTKRFGNLTAVDDLSFNVTEGELFAFLGTNGAGKSTTISCMTTLLAYEQGRIVLAGRERGTDDEGIRRVTGVVFQQSLLDPMLTTDENLAIRSQFYGAPASRIDELSDLVDLGDFRSRPYGVLSGGRSGVSTLLVRCCTTHRSSSWTSRPPASTPRPANRCGTPSRTFDANSASRCC